MRRYPLKKSIFVPPSTAEEAKFIELFVHAVNEAFYTGFELGASGNIEEYKTITPGQRCILMACAQKMMNDLFSDEPGKSSIGGENNGEDATA